MLYIYNPINYWQLGHARKQQIYLAKIQRNAVTEYNYYIKRDIYVTTWEVHAEYR